ncbi:hypothetical protein [Falsibacillus albus]|uniref:Uncharacterized protein n=1 Tax=Falsibacillus albus TaxID=2478915 RepID=A0A3L7JVM1_9BACI|nr:hypothetical protein [Falsibacillus albus]RLQ94796.1 hypothetical protein D9X91_12435 [Falsibacillus albus]
MKEKNKMSRSERKQKSPYKKWGYPFAGAAVLAIGAITAYPMIHTDKPTTATKSAYENRVVSNLMQPIEAAPSNNAAPKPEPTTEKPAGSGQENISKPEGKTAPDKAVKEQPKKETPDQTEAPSMTADQWKNKFKELWSSPREPFEKLILAYDKDTLAQGHHYLFQGEFKSEMKNGQLQAVSEYQHNKEGVMTNPSRLILKDQTLLHLHPNIKKYDKQQVKGMAKQIYNSADYFHPVPIFPGNYALANDNFHWTVVENNENEHWVKITAKNTEPNKAPDAPFAYKDHFTATIDTDNGILLDLKMYDDHNQIIESLNVTELKINDEVQNLDMDFTIPSDYMNMEDYWNNLVEFDDNWFGTAKQAIMKEYPVVEDAFYSGEDGNISFVLSLKDGIDPEKGKAIAKEFMEKVTENANTSEGYQKRGITIWSKNQYTFDVRIDVDQQSYDAYITEHNDQTGLPPMKWNKPTKRLSPKI